MGKAVPALKVMLDPSKIHLLIWYARLETIMAERSESTKLEGLHIFRKAVEALQFGRLTALCHYGLQSSIPY
jgi:hypothetical protein